MHVNTVHTAALAKMTKPAVVHQGKILPGKLLFSLSIYYYTVLNRQLLPDKGSQSVRCSFFLGGGGGGVGYGEESPSKPDRDCGNRIAYGAELGLN